MSDALHATPIGDERVTTDESAAVASPYDGHVIGRVPVCTPEHVDRAVAIAKERLADPLAPYERAEVLEAAVRVVHERNEELARIIAEEAAKPIATARTEAARTVETFRFAAIEARTLTGDLVPMTGASPGAGKLGFTLRVPVGVVGAISPFNFPLNLVAHKLAPAIAAGCPVVLKPASQTPLSAIRLVELLLDECGLPPGWVNVVTGKGGVIGNALVDHDDIAMITFTGSPDVGWGIKGRAPRKKVGLELGNNAPVIIEPDGDWETAADKIKVAGYSHAGQSCISTQRVFVHRSIVDDFTAALVERVRSLRTGDPLDDDVDVSSLISADETERVRDLDRRGDRRRGQGGDRRIRRRHRARADGPHRRRAGHGGRQERGVRSAGRHRGVRRPRATRSPAPTTPPTACRPPSSPATSAPRCGPRTRSTSVACSSTRCRPSGPTRCPTAASATAATPRKARTTPCAR